MDSLPSGKSTKSHITAYCDDTPTTGEVINNVYKIPSIKPFIRYLHRAIHFPTKANWLKAIRKDSYFSWPLVNIKNINKYLNESKDTQKELM